MKKKKKEEEDEDHDTPEEHDKEDTHDEDQKLRFSILVMESLIRFGEERYSMSFWGDAVAAGVAA